MSPVEIALLRELTFFGIGRMRIFKLLFLADNVLSPQGNLQGFVAIPTDEVTNCAFGGGDLKTLYVTVGGTLWSIRVDTPGNMTFGARK